MIRHYVARRAKVIEDHPHNAAYRSRSNRSGTRRRLPRVIVLALSLLQLDLPVGWRFWRGGRCGFGRFERPVALVRDPVGALDGAQAGGYAGLAGGDGLAVAPAVGAFGQGLAEALYFADVGFAFVGVGGDGEDGDAGRGGVQDEADGLAVRFVASQGDGLGSVGLGPGLPGEGAGFSGLLVEPGQHEVGAVHLVAGGAEVLADRAEGGAAGNAVFHEPGDLRLVGVVSGAGVEAQLGLQRLADRAGLDEADQAAGEDRCLRAGRQPDGQPPGGNVINRTAPAVRRSDTVVDETLVLGQVQERAALG